MNEKANEGMQASQSQLSISDIDKERAEVEGHIQRYQAELEAKNKDLKAIYQLIEESNQNPGDNFSASNNIITDKSNEQVVTQLRAKILEIQDLSYKIDELQSKNDELDL